MNNLKKLAVKSKEHFGLENFSAASVDEMLETRGGGITGATPMDWSPGDNLGGGGGFGVSPRHHVISASTGNTTRSGGFFTNSYHSAIRTINEMSTHIKLSNIIGLVSKIGGQMLTSGSLGTNDVYPPGKNPNLLNIDKNVPTP